LASPDEVKTFPTDWLVDQISIRQAEAHEDVRGLNGWNAVKAAIRTGDEIWSFCSLLKTWEALMGSCGIVLLRNGKKIAQVVTVRN
jgi:hypothetical protein